MLTLLIAIIYIAFIGLGLPDALLGAAWPVMVVELGAPISFMGIISTIISSGTIVSSLFSDRITRRLGSGPVTAISLALTTGGLFGFALSDSFLMLCLFAVPYGLGAGAVDAALNNYVAVYYASRQMSWLHCFWGVGATVGPYIMGYALATENGWRGGYSYVALIQLFITLVLLISLPLWKRRSTADRGDCKEADIGLCGTLKIRGVKPLLIAFFCYCAFESTTGLWASTYLTEYRGVDAKTAAIFASLFYLGITLGRFLCGFFADRAGDKRMIRGGTVIMLFGAILVILPIGSVIPALVGLVTFGLGASPVYPSIIHSTPAHFGAENSHAIVGIQMACAYCGATLMPPLFGMIAEHITIAIYPYYAILFIALIIFMTEKVNLITKQ